MERGNKKSYDSYSGYGFDDDYEIDGIDGYGYGYSYGSKKKKHDFTAVRFYRPDGDIKGKYVQWYLDNGFFQIDDDLWSPGSGYYKQFPDEKPVAKKPQIMSAAKKPECMSAANKPWIV